AGEPLLDLRLRRRQAARQRRTGLALALGELAAVLLGELPLLLGEERHRIGAGARQGALELRCTVLRLLLAERAQALLGLVQVNVDLLRARERAADEECAGGGHGAAREAARCECELSWMR